MSYLTHHQDFSLDLTIANPIDSGSTHSVSSRSTPRTLPSQIDSGSKANRLSQVFLSIPKVKIASLIQQLKDSESDYLDELYLLISYLSPRNPLYNVTQSIINLSAIPFLSYISIEQEPTFQAVDKLKQWVSYLPSSCHLLIVLDPRNRKNILKVYTSLQVQS